MSNTTQLQEDDNGLQALTTLSQFLEDDEWYPQQLGDKAIYHMGFSGDNGQMVCYAQIRVDTEQFLFYAVAPIKAPEETRMAAAEFITRANYGLRIGNFEMDLGDGEVRYKSGLDFEGATLTPELIRNAMYAAVQTMDYYLPGLMSVIYGGKPAAEAIAEIEGNLD